MLFRYSFTVPADTLPTDPVELYCELTHGVITGVWVGFPRGCAGMVNVRIFRHEHQVWPTNLGEALAWDNYVFQTDVPYELFQPPYQVLIRADSPDTCYPHEIMVAFELSTTPLNWWQGLISSVFGGGE
jgi:hypothetical protein